VIDVSEATLADVEEMGAFIRTLWEAAGPQAPGLTGATDEVIAEISSPDALRERVGGPERRVFLARVGPEVVGFAATRRLDPASVELAGIMVHPDRRGGVGMPLLEAAVRAARQSGYRRMVVHTETDNDGALRFYRKAGFTPLRRLDVDVEGHKVDVWKLERDL
jgi:ribosomal protein S18 acetylase RimI-like enzyme